MAVTMRGAREAPKTMRSSMETLIISLDEVEKLKVPPFQRPLRVNEKVRAMAEGLKKEEAITGVITLGKLAKETGTYIVDGQHRIEAFRLSGLSEVLCDVRVCHFDTLAEMADEFVNLNSALVRMRPDDVLRGLESTSPALKQLRADCDFVGYDQIRRGGSSSPILSMSAVLRCWFGALAETPKNGGGGFSSSAQMAGAIEEHGVEDLILFLRTAHAAWGRDPENYKLWSNLNLALCMWLWRRLVHDTDRRTERYVLLNIAQFKQCLMSLSATADYVDWLQGRVLTDRDRSPCYVRIKNIFVKRLTQEGGKAPQLPKPIWASR